jgi:hypothetical protein
VKGLSFGWDHSYIPWSIGKLKEKIVRVAAAGEGWQQGIDAACVFSGILVIL